MNAFRCRKIKPVMLTAVLLLAGGLVFAGSSLAETQSVQLEKTADSPASYALVYTVTGGRLQTTGIGLRFHYNSSAVDSAALTDVFGEGLVGIDNNAKVDIENFDGNPATDRYISFAWVGIEGDWPKSQPLPLKLGTIELSFKPGGDLVQMGISASSVAAGHTFGSKGF